MASGHADAITKLQFWSRKLKEDFTRENQNPSDHRRNVLRRGTMAGQLSKMNENALKVMQAETAMQQQSNEQLQVQTQLKEEIASL